MTLKTRLRRTDPTGAEPRPPMTLPDGHWIGLDSRTLLSGDSPAGPGVPVAHAVLLPTTPARAHPARRQRADPHPRRVADGVPVRICTPHRDGARAGRLRLGRRRPRDAPMMAV